MCKHVKDLIFAKVAEKLGLNADKYKEYLIIYIL